MILNEHNSLEKYMTKTLVEDQDHFQKLWFPLCCTSDALKDQLTTFWKFVEDKFPPDPSVSNPE